MHYKESVKRRRSSNRNKKDVSFKSPQVSNYGQLRPHTYNVCHNHILHHRHVAQHLKGQKLVQLGLLHIRMTNSRIRAILLGSIAFYNIGLPLQTLNDLKNTLTSAIFMGLTDQH